VACGSSMADAEDAAVVRGGAFQGNTFLRNRRECRVAYRQHYAGRPIGSSGLTGWVPANFVPCLRLRFALLQHPTGL
jgi:hypothetical protein